MFDLSVNKLDPNHEFAYVGREFGPVLMYWYKDRAGNYWLYTNAPEGHPDHDALAGEPFFNSEQPVPSDMPEFFSPEGYKLNMAVEPGADFQFNESYNPEDRANCWYGVVTGQDGLARYAYLDGVVRENMYLFLQQQIRVVDAQLLKLRKFYASLFASTNQHDKLLAAALILMEQGFFTIEDLVSLKVKDLLIRSDHIVLGGKRLACDSAFMDFMAEISKGKDVESFLLAEPTFLGDQTPMTTTYLYSVMAFLNMSPKFLPYAKASMMFSQIVHKNMELGVPPETVEAVADLELANSLFASPGVKHFVNPQLRKTLLEKYEQGIAKSFGNVKGDSTGLITLDSTLHQLNSQEQEYSQWVHSMPLHVLSASEVGI